MGPQLTGGRFGRRGWELRPLRLYVLVLGFVKKKYPWPLDPVLMSLFCQEAVTLWEMKIPNAFNKGQARIIIQTINSNPIKNRKSKIIAGENTEKNLKARESRIHNRAQH